MGSSSETETESAPVTQALPGDDEDPFVELGPDVPVAQFEVMVECGVAVRETPHFLCAQKKMGDPKGSVLNVMAAQVDCDTGVLMLQLVTGGWVPAATIEDQGVTPPRRPSEQLECAEGEGLALCQHVGGVPLSDIMRHVLYLKGSKGSPRRMRVEYEESTRGFPHYNTIFSRSGYHVECEVPGHARDIRVTFEAPPGTPVTAVNRDDQSLPWVKSTILSGKYVPECITFARPVTAVFEMRGFLTRSYVSKVKTFPSFNDNTSHEVDTAMRIESSRSRSVDDCVGSTSRLVNEQTDGSSRTSTH